MQKRCGTRPWRGPGRKAREATETSAARFGTGSMHFIPSVYRLFSVKGQTGTRLGETVRILLESVKPARTLEWHGSISEAIDTGTLERLHYKILLPSRLYRRLSSLGPRSPPDTHVSTPIQRTQGCRHLPIYRYGGRGRSEDDVRRSNAWRFP